MMHSFTATFGAKYLTGMVTSVPPPYETFSLIKNNILHQSKIYKNQKFLRYVTFRSRWSCDIQFQNYTVHINGDFDDKLCPQIVSVVPTTNAQLQKLW